MGLAWLFVISQLTFATVWQLAGFSEERESAVWPFVGDSGLWLMLAAAGFSVIAGLCEGLTGRNESRRWLVRMSGQILWVAFQLLSLMYFQVAQWTPDSPPLLATLVLIPIMLLAWSWAAIFLFSPSWIALAIGHYSRTRLIAARRGPM